MTIAGRRTRKGRGGGPERFVAPGAAAVSNPNLTLRVHLADRVLVEPGNRVEVGQPLIERCRETLVIEMSARPQLAAVKPGDSIDPAQFPEARGDSPRPGDRARLVFHGPDKRDRVAVGRHVTIVTSPVNGSVDSVTPGTLTLRADGIGFDAPVGWGNPVIGRLVIGVPGPDAELRASAVDVGAAGAILVAGARLDIEALTRARAIGITGIICGGIVGRELTQMEESDRRQRAALHAQAPFAIVALEGFGRRPIPQRIWDLLVAASGRPVGLAPEAGRVVIAGEIEPLLRAAERPIDAVRIVGGELAGAEGRLVGLAGTVRVTPGFYAPGGFVDFPAPGGRIFRRIVPLADLERIG
jgi:hypothetical protein